MNKRLSKKQMFFNKINLTKDDEIYVGLDVHKASYSVAIWLNDAPTIDFVMPADNKKLITLLDKLRTALKMVVYEAGPTGYGLARQLQKDSLPVKVIAPSKTPRPSARGSKTDQLDCRKLAKYAAKGLLKSIAIPTKLQEADRQFTRAREQLISKQTRVKLQIKSFLLQYTIKEPSGLTSWSIKAVNELKTITLSKQLRFSMDILLEELGFIQAQVKKIEKQLEKTFSEKRHAAKMKVLSTHPGVGPVIAGEFITEIFNPQRFEDRTELAKYVGLAPTITQSGQSQRDGPIDKTGRPQLRSNLIQGAWKWIAMDSNAYKTFLRILHNTGEKNKAITAMARRLAIHLWKMSCDLKPFNPAA